VNQVREGWDQAGQLRPEVLGWPVNDRAEKRLDQSDSAFRSRNSAARPRSN
jgi:hypothetical protein